ncbi:2-polyprenyl-3-methyl-6-methoxy-1,4-benzoquinone monooxygenase [Candidatus Rariloculus sp.]|uniref:2-polyprenyl-3-methyl-6-methoxy-1,4-benzoquinone monooxygenase n=1 Tax=Candidatus Rariloculus sp. TaxID=3101265 RepID=UPI003D0B4BA1
MVRRIGRADALISIIDEGLRSLAAKSAPSRRSPADDIVEDRLITAEREASIALLRVNHAGEISAQALYSGQSIFARSEVTRQHLLRAADEERDHLAWCAARLEELGGRRSFLDPLWYAGGALIGLAAGAAGDRLSLGFVTETERQVEAHLEDHLGKLPERDAKSRAILEQMAEDEARHGSMAQQAGGSPLSPLATRLMALGGGLVRRVALYI